MNMSNSAIDQSLRVLSELYNVNYIDLSEQLIILRSQILAKGLEFNSFSALSDGILTKTSAEEFPFMHFFYELILTLPFSSACCELAFSVMNEIKNKKRNRLGKILRALMVKLSLPVATTSFTT